MIFWPHPVAFGDILGFWKILQVPWDMQTADEITFYGKTFERYDVVNFVFRWTVFFRVACVGRAPRG